MTILFRNNFRRISPDFTEHEFFCKCPDFYDFCHPFDDELFKAAQLIRSYTKQPVTVNSSYRTPLCNEKCGGAPDSYHLLGKALDLNCGKSLKDVSSDISSKGSLYRSLRECGIHGFGLASSFIHIDTRSCGGYANDAVYGPYSVWSY